MESPEFSPDDQNWMHHALTLAGKAAGAQTVAVLSGFGEERELSEQGADLIIPSAAKLISLFGLS